MEHCDLSPIILDYLYCDLICTHPVHSDFRPIFPKTPGPWRKLAYVVSSVWNASLLLPPLTDSFFATKGSSSVVPPQAAISELPLCFHYLLALSTFWHPLKNKRPTSLPKREAFQNRKTWLLFVFQNLKLDLAPNKHLLHGCCLKKEKGMTFLNMKV